MVAAGLGRANAVAALLDAGADAAMRDGSGRTALHSAASSSGDPFPVISLLIDAGADPNALDSDRRTPLQVALERDRPVAFERLLELGAARHVDVGIVEALLDAGAEVNVDRAAGRTPLNVAMDHKPDPAILEALVRGGAKKCQLHWGLYTMVDRRMVADVGRGSLGRSGRPRLVLGPW